MGKSVGCLAQQRTTRFGVWPEFFPLPLLLAAMASPHPLILVPTAREGELIAEAFARAGRPDLVIDHCGFGPIAAAARTADLLARTSPAAVWLVGIAGCFGETLEVGQAYRFGQVACHGVGVGTGLTFTSAAELGWPQRPDDAGGESGHPQGDTLSLAVAATDHAASDRLLLTVCSASADDNEAAVRRARWPTASAEDMEGFGVALACRLRQVPCTIVRGISNRVGDRDKSTWQVAAATRAAADLVLASLEAGT